jgi:hypothetical protein
VLIVGEVKKSLYCTLGGNDYLKFEVLYASILPSEASAVARSEARITLVSIHREVSDQ